MTTIGKHMHEIHVTHRFIEISRTDETKVSFKSIMRCQDCGGQHRTLHLTTTNEANSNDDAPVEWSSEDWNRVREQFNQSAKLMAEWLDEEVKELLDGTKYDTIGELLAEIYKRYDGIVSASSMSFYQLDLWSKTRNKDFQRKVLLAYKQGLVCNRCDSIYEFNNLEVDHVRPDRSMGQLTNLQLLCRSCHNAKGKSPPGEKDSSPFKFEGEPCKHQLTCVKWANLCNGDN